MIFNSFQFLWSIIIIFIAYHFVIESRNLHRKIPKIGNYILIIISYALYLQWKPVYALILFLITAVTFLFGLIIERKKAFGNKRYIIWMAICLSIFPLLIFKYYNFISENLIALLGCLGFHVGLPGLNVAMPLGLSFFTLQSIGYVWDVYYKRINAEHNWWDYMLFICFFPQITSGPISKAKDLLPQIKNTERTFCYTQSVQGLKWILWGMFLKVVVADRLGMTVDYIFNAYTQQSGMFCLLASVFYSFQIYGDFAGYSFMAVGVGELMGFELVNNFRRPYLSVSVTDFWHRWHISLSLWLKDYVYIPLGGSRCSKIRNYWNILVTFLVSGIWHGANWTFIIWGFLHGLFQIVEKMFHLQKCENSGLKWFRILVTFVCVDFAWIFFRMPTVSDALSVINKIFTDLRFSVDVDLMTLLWCFVLIMVVCLKDLGDEYNISSLRVFHHKITFIRWFSYVTVLFLILFSGVLDASQFIYVKF